MSYHLYSIVGKQRQLVSDDHANPSAAMEAGSLWISTQGYEIVDGWHDVDVLYVLIYRGLNRPSLGWLIVEKVKEVPNA